MPGRRWSDGLHQAVEAKEKVKIERENQTLATVTFQNYFRKYDKLAGMTGTAETEATEFAKIYELDVFSVPTKRPLVRIEEPDLIYRTSQEKYNAIVDDIIATQGAGRPVLAGTVSIEKSERLSGLLKRRGVKHTVLNAKYHDKEAEIVAQAGREGTVTIATNMAGRGTDILLGGNPEHMARRQALSEGVAERLPAGEQKFVDDDEFAYFSHDGFYRVPRVDWDGSSRKPRRRPRPSTRVSSRRADSTSLPPSGMKRGGSTISYGARRPPGRSGIVPVLSVARGRSDAHLRLGPDPGPDGSSWHGGRGADRARHGDQGD